MKLTLFRLAALPVALALQSCALAKPTESNPILISPSSDFCIPDQDLVGHFVKAESGSVDDMKRLYWHYIGCEVNRELAFYWGKRAADACDAEMQDDIEQWLHSFRDKSIEKTIPTITSAWKKRCAAESK